MRCQPFFLLLTLSLTAAPLAAVTAYPYGSLPTAASDADLTSAYNLWKTRRVATASCGKRVDNGGGTYSEGMGYGMLMAAYLEPNDTLLNDFYTFFAANLDSRGVMNWSVGSNSCSNNNANGASDGDMDVALALLKAAKRWPASSNNWAARTTTLLNAMYTNYKDSCNGLKPGDVWGGCGESKAYNPSYMRTGYMHSFDCFEGGSRWEVMRTRSYTTLGYWYSNYSLPPDWTNPDGSFNSGNYGYDACRTPWVIGMDYLWWGNSTAKSMDDKITASFAAQGTAASIGDGYNYSNGTKTSNNHQPEFFGGVGVASMCGTNSSFRDALYTELKTVDKNTYFSDSLRVLYLMAMTGNFQEPCNGGGAPGTPTRTATRTPTFTASPTPTPAFSLSKSGSTSAPTLGSTYSYYLDYQNLSSGPDTVGVTSGVSLDFHNSNAGSSGSRTNVNYRIDNNSGGTISLSNYRIRYFMYDAAKTATSDYASYEYNDGSGQGTGSILVYSPAYTTGALKADMEQRIVFAGGTLGNGANVVWEGALGSNSDSWTMAMSDDWSYPGSVGSYSAAAAQNVVLEQNVAGTWKLASGAYPGGAAAITNVNITDALSSKLNFVSSVPSGTYSGGTLTVVLPSLASGAAGRITLTVQLNGTAGVGNVIANSANISASGYPSSSSNTYNVTVAGAANTPTRTATRTATRTPTRTDTPTATRTATTVPATSTDTRTATPTATRTSTAVPATSTDTRTATPTATRTSTAVPATSTNTRTATPTATRTFTAVPATSTDTRTATRTATLSATAVPATSTDTRTATPTATRTDTRTDTRTATRTATPTDTRTDTRTSSPTPTVTVTFTDVPPGSSATNTSTISPTRTISPTATPSRTSSATPTVSPSNTRTDSPTLSATASGTPSASPSSTRTGSPTLSVTASATQTSGPSATASPTAAGSFTDSPTASRTATPSATGTASLTDSPTSSKTATASQTRTDSPTATATGTPTVTPSATVTLSATPVPLSSTLTQTALPTATGSPTPSATASVSPANTATVTLTPTSPSGPTATFTPTLTFTTVPSVVPATDGPLQIGGHAAWPNPIRPQNPAFVSVELLGRADSVSLKLYTRSWILIAETRSGPQPKGWMRFNLPAAFLDRASNDAYYYLVSAERGGNKVIKPARGILQVLR